MYCYFPHFKLISKMATNRFGMVTGFEIYFLIFITYFISNIHMKKNEESTCNVKKHVGMMMNHIMYAIMDNF